MYRMDGALTPEVLEGMAPPGAVIHSAINGYYIYAGAVFLKGGSHWYCMIGGVLLPPKKGTKEEVLNSFEDNVSTAWRDIQAHTRSAPPGFEFEGFLCGRGLAPRKGKVYRNDGWTLDPIRLL